MADSTLSELLLVYGTLKRGHANHHQLAGAIFVGEARLEQLDLHDLGPFPMAVPGAGHVIGELFRVSLDSFPALDRFEGVPRLYRRWRWRSSDGPWLWVYLGSARQVRHARRLVDGLWGAACPPPGRQDAFCTAPDLQDR